MAEPGVVLTQPVAEVAQARPQSKLPWVAAIVLMGVVAGVAVWNLKPAPEPGRVSRSAYDLPEDQALRQVGNAVVALSPDGSGFVYNTTDGLYLRSMDELEARLIAGTEAGSRNPFFSPNGQWVAFDSGSQLQKIAINGGAPVGLGPVAGRLIGASWGVDDMILFGQSDGIFRVSANGGEPELIIEEEEGELFDGPQLLRDDWILFSIGTGPGTWDNAQIVVQSLETGERKTLWTGSDARYVPTGHLVYALDDDLFAVPFDIDTLEVTGGAVALVEGVERANNTASANYGISDDGSLVYLASGGTTGSRTLVSVDREGNVEPLGAPARAYSTNSPRLSRDGQRMLILAEGDAWSFDIVRQTLTRLTFEGAGMAIWTPDGEYVTYRNTGASPQSVYRRRADGTGTEERLTTGLRDGPSSWSPDGQFLAYYQTVDDVEGETGRDIWIKPMDGDQEPWPFLQTPFNEAALMFSPDGQWVAYVSDETGNNEVYVLPFPGPGGKRQISTEGGGDPQWARDGQELFYLNGNQMMVVDIETEPAFRAGTPTLLFESNFIADVGRIARYDVTADGEFVTVMNVLNNDGQAEPPQIDIVLNWVEELKERVPVP